MEPLITILCKCDRCGTEKYFESIGLLLPSKAINFEALKKIHNWGKVPTADGPKYLCPDCMKGFGVVEAKVDKMYEAFFKTKGPVDSAIGSVSREYFERMWNKEYS